MTKVALSGASGNIGQVLRPALLKLGFGLRSAGGRRALTQIAPDEEVCHGDLREAAFVDTLLTGVDVLVHMAGTSVERPLPEIIENNLVALNAVYEGARATVCGASSSPVPTMPSACTASRPNWASIAICARMGSTV